MEFIVFVFGLMVGSFLNVLADRLPFDETVIWGRSYCDHCRKPLRWFELVPVLSYIILGARCRRCRKSISIQYPLVEIVTAVGFLLLWGIDGYGWHQIAAFFVIFCSGLVLLVSDMKYQILPDSMIIVFGLASLVRVWAQPTGDLPVHAAASVGTGLFFYGIWIITRGRGMGFGDVKLSLVLGLLLGFPRVVVALYAAFLTGATAGVILILTGKKKLKSKIAFGPFLLLGAAVALVWGNSISAWWKGML